MSLYFQFIHNFKEHDSLTSSTLTNYVGSMKSNGGFQSHELMTAQVTLNGLYPTEQ